MIPMTSVRTTHQYLEFEALLLSLSLSFDFLRFHSILRISCILTLLDISTLAVQLVPFLPFFFPFSFLPFPSPALIPSIFHFPFSLFPFPISFIFKCSLSSFHLSHVFDVPFQFGSFLSVSYSPNFHS